MEELIGLYLHIPFCLRKCRYCDFVSYPDGQAWWPDYLQAILTEIRSLPPLCPQTLYVGGGTPTIWPSEYLRQLITAAKAVGLPESAEATLEANPGTVTLETLSALRQSGYNRLSFGLQSTFNANLRLLGRVHNYNQAQQALVWARQAGFSNINIDLIYGLPGQSLADWQLDLARAVALGSEHFSAYALSLEEGTPLAQAVSKGFLPEPDSDLAADMYELTEDFLAVNGYVHYEISNWARQQKDGRLLTSQHNLLYWHNQPYIGLGCGAHSSLDGQRFARVANPALYLAYKPEARIVFSENIDRPLAMAETAILELRLLSGLSRQRFRERYGVDLLALYREQWQWAQQEGLLLLEGDSFRLTRKGRLLSNELFQALLP